MTNIPLPSIKIQLYNHDYGYTFLSQAVSKNIIVTPDKTNNTNECNLMNKITVK